MKKDTIFRVINGVGFAANAASMCFPYMHPTRLVCKLASGVCNISSVGMLIYHGLRDLFIENKKSGLGVAFIATYIANEASVMSMNNISHMHDHPEDMGLDAHYLLRDGSVAAVQLLNLTCGMYPQKESVLPSLRPKP